jgi:hypothetical protein
MVIYHIKLAERIARYCYASAGFHFGLKTKTLAAWLTIAEDALN